jgi:hypothetical protein
MNEEHVLPHARTRNCGVAAMKVYAGIEEHEALLAYGKELAPARGPRYGQPM